MALFRCQGLTLHHCSLTCTKTCMRNVQLTSIVCGRFAVTRDQSGCWCAQSQLPLSAQQCKQDTVIHMQGLKQQGNLQQKASGNAAVQKRIGSALAMCTGESGAMLNVKSKLKV